MKLRWDLLFGSSGATKCVGAVRAIAPAHTVTQIENVSETVGRVGSVGINPALAPATAEILPADTANTDDVVNLPSLPNLPGNIAMSPFALQAWEVRAAIMEYDGGVPRTEAERLAMEALCGGLPDA